MKKILFENYLRNSKIYLRKIEFFEKDFSGIVSYHIFGKKLLNNLLNFFSEIYEKRNFFEIESSIINSRNIFKGSGHLKNFFDKFFYCNDCGFFSKEEKDCKNCKKKLILKKFGMYKLEDENLFLRPETTQGIIYSFKDLFDNTFPLKIFQKGKVFRNEIRTKKFRFKEFYLFEVFKITTENFFNKYNGEKNIFQKKELNKKILNLEIKLILDLKNFKFKKIKMEEYIEKEKLNKIISKEIFIILENLKNLGLKEEKIFFYYLEASNLAHYSLETWDIYYEFEKNNLIEIVGISNRLNNDFENIKKNFKDIYKKIYKNISDLILVEFSFGVERIMKCLLKENFKLIEEKETLLLKPKLSPFICSINPLIEDNKLIYLSKKIYDSLIYEGFKIIYLNNKTIGKRYTFCDYYGITYSVTIDFESLENETITIRNILDKSSIRLKINKLENFLRKSLTKNIIFINEKNI